MKNLIAKLKTELSEKKDIIANQEKRLNYFTQEQLTGKTLR